MAEHHIEVETDYTPKDLLALFLSIIEADVDIGGSDASCSAVCNGFVALARKGSSHPKSQSIAKEQFGFVPNVGIGFKLLVDNPDFGAFLELMEKATRILITELKCNTVLIFNDFSPKLCFVDGQYTFDPGNDIWSDNPYFQ
jgi:hypothetical protein